MESLSPIVLFVYNRPWHTKQTIGALLKNELSDQSPLIIYSDAANKPDDKEAVRLVRKYIHKIEGFKSVKIHERRHNLGLSKSIIDGVTSVIEEYGCAVVLEDDVVTSPYFLRYMNAALNYYKNTEQIYTISGYTHPPEILKIPPAYKHDVYFNYRAFSWGWGTWADRWSKVDWDVSDFPDFIKNRQQQKNFNRCGDDMSKLLKLQMNGKIDSWAIRWCYSLFKHDALSVFPVFSYVNNIGLDGSGIHCGTTYLSQNDLNLAKKSVLFPEQIYVDKKIMHNFRKIYRLTLYAKLIRLIKTKLYYYNFKRGKLTGE